jgi:prepilin-type N-terminal cleavage/methylation domain-containing protein
MIAPGKNRLFPNPRALSRRVAAFSLVEIMIALAIVGALVTIAVPSYVRAQRSAVMGKIAHDMKVYREAVEVYNADTSSYPADTTNTFPNELKDGQYIEAGVYRRYDFGSTLPMIGGNYDWDYDVNPNYKAAIVLANLSNNDPALLTMINNAREGDDNLSGGNIFTDSNHLIYIVER